MAYGDTKYTRTRGSSGGSSYSYDYDDEGRGRSKDLYEEFSRRFQLTRANLFDETIISNAFIIRLVSGTTWRYNLHDFVEGIGYTYNNSVSDFDNADGRIKRDIEKACDKGVWKQFLQRVLDVYSDKAEIDWMEGIARGIISIGHSIVWRQEEEKRQAERLQRLQEENDELRKEAQLTVGALQSDFEEAFKIRESYDQYEGDWLDDPVTGYMTGQGFGEEVTYRQGIKFQVTLSLDLSNSMRHNRVADMAQEVAINLHIAMDQLCEMYPGQIFFQAFTFSYDINEWTGSSTVEKLGRGAKRVELKEREIDSQVEGVHIGAAEKLKDVWFEGQDTWMYPLFEEIEKWEIEESAPGCVKLDLVISDAVLEHPKDIRDSDVIQDRRDGSLQTIILNLMPERHWHNGALPRHCVQYPVNQDNLAGIARTLISEFLQVHL